MKTTKCNKILWMLNTAMERSKERYQGRKIPGQEWGAMTQSENGVVEEVFLSILNDKIKSAGKKKKTGRKNNKQN